MAWFRTSSDLLAGLPGEMPVRLVVLTVFMPTQSAFESAFDLVPEVRTLTGGAPVWISTAHAESGIDERWRHLCDRFVMAPPDEDEIIAELLTSAPPKSTENV